MGHDRSIRRLSALSSAGASARVLNLMKMHLVPEREAELASAPFFQSPVLDHCIVLKHRLRPNEYDIFSSERTTGTKILVPLDRRDLRCGAYYCFIGQKDFEAIARERFGLTVYPGSQDWKTLQVLDRLPSLDPFLLKETLRREGHTPAQAYFNITEAETQRMFQFAYDEMGALIKLTGAAKDSTGEKSKKMVELLLSNAADERLEPLRLALQLSEQEYIEGLFAWRGFLYYKWIKDDMAVALRKTLTDMRTIRPFNIQERDTLNAIEERKMNLLAAMMALSAKSDRDIQTYSDAYSSLVHRGDALAFREFLLSAHDLFVRLGEQLGIVQHVVSFWNYRFPEGQSRVIEAQDLLEIFIDFELGLSAESMPNYEGRQSTQCLYL